MATTKKTAHPDSWRGSGWTRTHLHWQECKMVQPPRQTAWQLVKKWNLHLLYNLAIPLLDIYSRGMKTYVRTKTCTWILTEVLFVTAKTWNHPGNHQMVTIYQWWYVRKWNTALQYNGITDRHDSADESQNHCAEWKCTHYSIRCVYTLGSSSYSRKF